MEQRLTTRAKRWLRETARSMGVHVYTDRSLPTGVDWLHDIRRSGTLGREPICFDVGANVGQTVLEIKRHFPAARVHAFEPFAAPRSVLMRNCGQIDGVSCQPLALGAEPGRLSAKPAADSLRSSLRPGSGAETAMAETVTIETVDRYCAERGIDRIDILKTDTEGYDLEVLNGAEGLMREHRVGYVLAEVTFEPLDPQHTPARSLMDRLEGFGYRFLGLYETYPLHHFHPPEIYCNALFVSRQAWRTAARSGNAPAGPVATRAGALP